MYSLYEALKIEEDDHIEHDTHTIMADDDDATNNPRVGSTLVRG